MKLHHYPKSAILVLGMILAAASACLAQVRRAGMMRVATIYVAPDATSEKLGEVERGREVVIIEGSREWLKVSAELGPEKLLTGWILQKGVVEA